MCIYRSLSFVILTLMLNVSHAGDEERSSRRLELSAKDTLTVVEMNRGDELQFQLRNGEVRTFVLEGTSARVVERIDRGMVYFFECRVVADGQPLTLRRFVCSQETFYEPWVINGVRIWLSSSASIFEHVPIRYPEQHHPLDADAVIALQDATLPICPQSMKLWFPIDRHFLDVGKCYHGDDPWLGPYLGKACHMGLDLNMPKGTPLYAPIDFDTQWIFSSDHRWRGVRRWKNGDIWGLQSHHLDRLLVQEDTSLEAGVHYAEAAGKAVGAWQHSHFEFRVGEEVLNRGTPSGLEIDPWILFWQIFETDQAAKGMIHAEIPPLSPATTGTTVKMSAAGSRPSAGRAGLRYFWTFGDGGWSNAPSPEHLFISPGVYPITLVITDGQNWATKTQHLTVNGEMQAAESLTLEAADNVTFRQRPVYAADVYGWPVHHVPHTLRFTAIPDGSLTSTQHVSLRNSGSGTLPPAEAPEVQYFGGAKDWLRLHLTGEGNTQRLDVVADPRTLSAGLHEAVVTLRCRGVVNETQGFRVEFHVRPSPEALTFVVDDRDKEFFATPFAWVGHQNARASRKGFKRRYLTNGAHAEEDAVVRYTPDLSAGKYEASFHPETPFAESHFQVRIRHASGEQILQFTPRSSEALSLGTFEFAEGTDGFVEISSVSSKGLVVADAVVFQKCGPVD